MNYEDYHSSSMVSDDDEPENDQQSLAELFRDLADSIEERGEHVEYEIEREKPHRSIRIEGDPYVVISDHEYVEFTAGIELANDAPDSLIDLSDDDGSDIDLDDVNVQLEIVSRTGEQYIQIGLDDFPASPGAIIRRPRRKQNHIGESQSEFKFSLPINGETGWLISEFFRAGPMVGELMIDLPGDGPYSNTTEKVPLVLSNLDWEEMEMTIGNRKFDV